MESPEGTSSRKRKSLSPDGKTATTPSPYRSVRKRRSLTSLPSSSAVELEQSDIGSTDLPSDTLVALQVLQSQFPSFEKSKIRVPIMLKSQLLSILTEHTEAERELDQLKRDSKIRVFKLQMGRNEYAIMLQEDYLAQIENAKQRATKAGHPGEVFDNFVDRVLPACLADEQHYSCSKDRLYGLLFPDGDVKDDHLTILINAGLFIHSRGEDNNYWFSIPNAGTFLKSCMKGREEILRMLNRQKHKEMLQQDLEKKKLRSSTLGPSFHLKDLLGQGTLESVSTTAGPLIRVVIQK